MNTAIKTNGINLFSGAAGAAAAAITTSLGDIQGLGDLGGYTGGETMDVTNKNQVLAGGGEDVVKRTLPKKIKMAPLSFTLRCGAGLAQYSTVAALKMLVKGFKIAFPLEGTHTTPCTLHGDGFITECKLAGGGDDVLVNVTIEPTGDDWTVTAGTGGT